MSMRSQLFASGLSGLSQSESSSPAGQRDDAKRNFWKRMRPLPTQHYWNVWFDRHRPDQNEINPLSNPSNPSNPSSHPNAKTESQVYNPNLEQLGDQIESVQDFWRYANNTPVEMIKVRESIYLFKSGFRPVWEDRRNLNGGSWTFRVSKSIGPELWKHVQLLAIGEQLQSALEDDDQLCGVGLSVRFNAHLITIWHRDSSKQKSIENIETCVLENIPDELRPKKENSFYKKHTEHAGFKAPPELQAVLDSQKRAAEANANRANPSTTSIGADDQEMEQ